jgi:hypothetical protein
LPAAVRCTAAAAPVAAAVGAVPAHRGQRRELRGVLLGVQVAGQAHPADDQLAGLAHADRVAVRADHGQLPAGQRQPDPDRALAGQRGGTGDHGGLGGPVGVPDLAALDGQPLGQFRRAGLAAEDQQPDVFERLDRPQRGQGRHGGDHGDPLLGQPGTQVDAAAHQRTLGRHQAGAVPPGQPHLLAGGVERHRQPGQDPVVRADRRLGGTGEEEPRLGVHERGGRAVADRDTLRGAGGAGGEDDPGVVVGSGPARPPLRRTPQRDGAAVAEHRADVRLAEDQLGALLRVVRVDRHVRRTGREHTEDRQVELGGAGGDTHADPVADADPVPGEQHPHRVDLLGQFAVGERLAAVVDRAAVVDGESAGMRPHGVVEDVGEGAADGGGGEAEHRRGRRRGNHQISSHGHRSCTIFTSRINVTRPPLGSGQRYAK